MSHRLLGWGLIVYGLAGIVLVVATAIFGLATATELDALTEGARGSLEAAERSTDAAAEALAGVDASLAESETSADSAATLARDASATLEALARAMELSVFGAQPLLPLADDFATSATQASALGDTLDRLRASLASSGPDVSRIGGELSGLSSQLGSMREAMGDDGEATPVLPLALLLLAWLLVPAIGGLMGGLALLGLIRPLRPAG